MASVNFLYRSTKDKAPLTLRLLYRYKGKDFVFPSKVKYEVEKNYWKVHKKNTRDATIRNKQIEVNTELQKIENFVLDAFKSANINQINKEWLNEQIYLYYNPPTNNKYSDLVVDVIEQKIKDAPHLDNGKGGIGLGECRVNSYGRLKEMFNDFQGKKRYRVKDLDLNVFKAFRKWLSEDNSYSPSYTAKKLSDLKGICKYGASLGLEVSDTLGGIKTKQVSAYDEDMDVIILKETEIEKIEQLDLDNEALINARKWLILGCYTGQRGKALTIRIRTENFVSYGKDLVIKFIQKKGNKTVLIPVLPKVKEIYENGMPYTVSVQKLNKHYKTLGKLAGIDEMILGRIQEGKRGIKKLRPKYQYMSTHIGRKSFASNHYGKIPTPIIMRVTGHSKESTFLTYINQSDDSHIATFLDYYKTKELKEQRQPQLKVIKEAQ